MPKIFELLGYPLENRSPSVQDSRRHIFCPFMGAECDGGGNRFMSEISLTRHPELYEFFDNREKVPCGVCSIQLSNDTPPWIICPRRLLYMGKKADPEILLGVTQRQLLEKCDFERGTTIGVWTEVKVHYKYQRQRNSQEFNYTFDYILMPLGRVGIEDACASAGIKGLKFEKILNRAGFTLGRINGEIIVDNFPLGQPVIVEVMTSSTSGGNKKKRTSITQAFEYGILGETHSAPGINYRQVWARMASQLIVKSQAGMAWGGKAIWVLQDTLADYISSSTALELSQFISGHTGEVNILAYSYDNAYLSPPSQGTIPLKKSILYAGPIHSKCDNARSSFQDIILASILPPREVLIYSMCKKGFVNYFVMP